MLTRRNSSQVSANGFARRRWQKMRSRGCDMKMTTRLLLVCAIFSSYAAAGAAQLEALDPRFGDQSDGRQIIGFPGGYALAYAATTDAEGRLLLAGEAQDEEQLQRGAVVRLNADGTIDPKFSHELTPLPIGGTYIGWSGVASANDGGIIVAGVTQLPDRIGGIVCKLDANGNRANAFGTIETPGCVIIGSAEAITFINAIAMQHDGSVLLAGSEQQEGENLAARIWRLTPTGQPDIAFGNEGTAELPDDYYLNSEYIAIDVAGDDSISAAGNYGSDSNSTQMLVARFTKQGDLLTEFAGGSRVVPFTHLPYDQRMSSATSVHVTRDGSVIVGGLTRTGDFNGANFRPALVKLDAQGHGVESFGTPGLPSGQRIVDPCNAPPCKFSPRMIFAPDGTIFIAGSVEYSQFSIRKAFAMALTPAGEIDPSFADSDETFKTGVATAWWPEASYFGAATLQGKRVVLAGSVTIDDETKMAAIRFRGGILFSDGFGDD